MNKEILDTMVSYVEGDRGHGDITTEGIFDTGLEASAEIIAKEEGKAAGIGLIKRLFERYDCTFKPEVRDGDQMRPGSRIAKVSGPIHSILLAERVALNILSRMSGVATMVSEVLKKARAVNPDIRIAATRKTTPGFSRFEKMAVAVGGGDTHRYRLDDAVLIKDNHIMAFRGDLEDIIEKARASVSFSKKVEIEVRTLEEAKRAASAGADIIMLDNFSEETTEQAYREIKAADPRILVEISGGININNVDRYAPNADVISMGAITHSYPSIDLSLNITGTERRG